MLFRLLPDQVAAYWPSLRDKIEEALPPICNGHIDRMENLLQAVLQGRLDLWVVYKKEDNRIEMYAVMLTSLLDDDVSRTKNLLIYALASLKPIPEDVWVSGIQAIISVAKSRKCDKILAYTCIPAIARLAEQRLGADTSWTMITFGV